MTKQRILQEHNSESEFRLDDNGITQWVVIYSCTALHTVNGS